MTKPRRIRIRRIAATRAGRRPRPEQIIPLSDILLRPGIVHDAAGQPIVRVKHHPRVIVVDVLISFDAPAEPDFRIYSDSEPRLQLAYRKVAR
jgi:hypothetical protein